MLGAAILIVMFVFGVSLVTADKGPVIWVIVGWACIVFPIIKWRVILTGLRRSGMVLAFVLVVAVLAAVFNGEGALWNLFF